MITFAFFAGALTQLSQCQGKHIKPLKNPVVGPLTHPFAVRVLWRALPASALRGMSGAERRHMYNGAIYILTIVEGDKPLPLDGWRFLSTG